MDRKRPKTKTIGVSVIVEKDGELLKEWEWLKEYAKKRGIPLKEALLRAIKYYKSQLAIIEALATKNQ